MQDLQKCRSAQGKGRGVLEVGSSVVLDWGRVRDVLRSGSNAPGWGQVDKRVVVQLQRFPRLPYFQGAHNGKSVPKGPTTRLAFAIAIFSIFRSWAE